MSMERGHFSIEPDIIDEFLKEWRWRTRARTARYPAVAAYLLARIFQGTLDELLAQAAVEFPDHMLPSRTAFHRLKMEFKAFVRDRERPKPRKPT